MNLNVNVSYLCQGVRVGAEIQAAEVLVSARERTSGLAYPLDAHAGENMVSEPQVQVQTSGQGKANGGSEFPGKNTSTLL